MPASGKLSSGHMNGKVNFHFSPKEGKCRRMFKLPQDCTHLTYQHGNTQNSTSKLQQNVNHELADVQKRFRIGRGTRDQIANMH